MNVQHAHLLVYFVMGLQITCVLNVVTTTFYSNKLILVLQLVKVVFGLMDLQIIYAKDVFLSVYNVPLKLFAKIAKRVFIYKPKVVLYLQIVQQVLTLMMI